MCRIWKNNFELQSLRPCLHSEFHVTLLFSDAPVSELSLELLLLQVVLPALLEQGHTRQWLKRLVAAWTVGVAWLLDLRSYLIGDVTLKEGVRRSSGFLIYLSYVLERSAL